MEQNNYITKEVYEQIKDFKFYHLPKEQKEIVDKLVPNEELKGKYRKYSLCGECYQPCTKRRWCSPCISKRFQDNLKNWTSGNKDIDEFIQNLQIRAEHYPRILEWIEYDRFYDVEFLSAGGFGTVSKAKWKDGYIIKWDVKNNDWYRIKEELEEDHHKSEDHKMVVLKSLYNSQNISHEYIQEVLLHVTMNSVGNVVQCYGMSKDPKTGNIIIVMDYKRRGSLRHYLDKNYYSMYGEEKLQILYNIALGLRNIHKQGLVHRDFHSGNILKGIKFEAIITDLGLSRRADQVQKDNVVNGVLPYVAPEVLRKEKYTEKSDIYSFGMICYEVISGFPPHYDRPHNGLLMFDILKGLRPEFKIKVPKLLSDLIKKCLDEDPMKRPYAGEAYETLFQWWEDLSVPNYDSKFYKQYVEASEHKEQVQPTNLQNPVASQLAYTINPEAIYKSRALEIPDPTTFEIDYTNFDEDDDDDDE